MLTDLIAHLSSNLSNPGFHDEIQLPVASRTKFPDAHMAKTNPRITFAFLFIVWFTAYDAVKFPLRGPEQCRWKFPSGLSSDAGNFHRSWGSNAGNFHRAWGSDAGNFHRAWAVMLEISLGPEQWRWKFPSAWWAMTLEISTSFVSNDAGNFHWAWAVILEISIGTLRLEISINWGWKFPLGLSSDTGNFHRDTEAGNFHQLRLEISIGPEQWYWKFPSGYWGWKFPSTEAGNFHWAWAVILEISIGILRLEISINWGWKFPLGLSSDTGNFHRDTEAGNFHQLTLEISIWCPVLVYSYRLHQKRTSILYGTEWGGRTNKISLNFTSVLLIISGDILKVEATFTTGNKFCAINVKNGAKSSNLTSMSFP